MDWAAGFRMFSVLSVAWGLGWGLGLPALFSLNFYDFAELIGAGGNDAGCGSDEEGCM